MHLHKTKLQSGNRNKRSQIEMVGLVIIVVLLSLGVFFIIRFVVLRAPSTIEQSFTQTQLAANSVNAMLMTTTNCRGFDMTELLGDCVTNAPYGTRSCSGSFGEYEAVQYCSSGYNKTFCTLQCDTIRERCVREYTKFEDRAGLDINEYISGCTYPDATLHPWLDQADSFYPSYDLGITPEGTVFTSVFAAADDYDKCVSTCIAPEFTQSECLSLIEARNASIRSCEYVTQQASFIYYQTLSDWKQKYRFSVFQGAQFPEYRQYDSSTRLWLSNYPDFSQCTNIGAKTYPLPYSRLPIIVQMELCS